MSAGESGKRPWVGWLVRVVVVAAVLAGIAHARHQTVGQLVSDATGTAGHGFNIATGMFGRVVDGFAEPEIAITPTSGRLPAHITVTGTGYQPGEQVEISAHIAVLASPVADDKGTFTATILVPADAFCPEHQCSITASGKRSVKWITAPYDVTGGGRIVP